MRKMLQYAGVCALAATVSGCSMFDKEQTEAPRIDTIGVQERQSAVAEGKLIGDTLLDALKSNNYAAVEKLPIGDEKARFTKEHFDALYKRVQSRNGIAGFQYLGDLNMKPYHRLVWKVSFNDQPGKPGEGVEMVFEVVVFRRDGVNRVARFGFRP